MTKVNSTPGHWEEVWEAGAAVSPTMYVFHLSPQEPAQEPAMSNTHSPLMNPGASHSKQASRRRKTGFQAARSNARMQVFTCWWSQVGDFFFLVNLTPKEGWGKDKTHIHTQKGTSLKFFPVTAI